MDKAVVEQRLKSAIDNDEELKRFAGQIKGNSEAKTQRIAELETSIREKGVKRGELLNEIKKLRAQASNLFHNAATQRNVLKRVRLRHPINDARLFKLIARRTRHLRKVVTAQVAHEAMKQFRKNIK